MREAGILQVVTNPLWVAKTRLQTQHMQLQWRRQQGALYTGAFNALLRMTREEGLLGLYRCQPSRGRPGPLSPAVPLQLCMQPPHHSIRKCLPFRARMYACMSHHQELRGCYRWSQETAGDDAPKAGWARTCLRGEALLRAVLTVLTVPCGAAAWGQPCWGWPTWPSSFHFTNISKPR